MSLGIIGGTGATEIDGLIIRETKSLTTPFGKPSAEYIIGELAGVELIFLARHGNPHTIAPHKINYRANLWGLKELGVEKIIALAAVGGITGLMQPAHLTIPDQIIDYSYGREHSFFAEDLDAVQHIDFSYPYTAQLREKLIDVAAKKQLIVSSIATYGCTQGPRLETAAEIKRMENDGCDIVGMTGMPEAALARELKIDYATLAVVANWAAGKTDGEITMSEIEQHVNTGMQHAMQLLSAFIQER